MVPGIRDRPDGEKGNPVHVAHVSRRRGFHVCAERGPGGRQPLPLLPLHEVLPGDHSAEKHPASRLQLSGRPPGQRQEARVTGKPGGGEPGVKVRQKILPHIVISRLRGDHRVEHRKASVNPACGAGIDDRIAPAGADQGLGRDGGVDLAHAGKERRCRDSLQRSLPAPQHPSLRSRGVFQHGQKGSQLAVRRAQDSDFHNNRPPLPAKPFFPLYRRISDFASVRREERRFSGRIFIKRAFYPGKNVVSYEAENQNFRRRRNSL